MIHAHLDRTTCPDIAPDYLLDLKSMVQPTHSHYHDSKRRGLQYCPH